MLGSRFYLCIKTANRGQCVTKYRAAVRPAFIGGRERDAEGGAGGEGGEDGERWAIVGGFIVK